jgi:membrane-bound metal-dependent hydrolase YbcI (DUF457 family)
MANYRTHLAGGIVAGMLGGCVAWSLGMVGPYGIPAVALSGVAGGIAPDVDHDHSRPTGILFTWASVLIPTMALWRIESLQSPWDRAASIWIGLALFVFFPGKALFKKLTRHRGIFHSVPAIGIFGTSVYLLFGREIEDISLQLAMGATGSLGYLTHLVLDEVWAVDFNGKLLPTKKRSFGTALALRKKSIPATAAAYILLAGTLTVSVLDYRGDRPEVLYIRHVLGQKAPTHKRPVPGFLKRARQMPSRP